MRGAALVTGAGRRIGRALSFALAGAGFDVAIHYRDGAAQAQAQALQAQALADEIEAKGRRAVALAADLSRDHDLPALVERAARQLGPLTLLVNNAARFEDDRFGSLTVHGWDGHMATNLRAPVLLSQAFAAQTPDGAENGVALILNIVDQRVFKPNPQFFSYTLSKCALWSATRMMAQALAPRIRVNAIGPGPTLPSVYQDEALFAAEAAATPLGRGSSLDDICAAALYLVDAKAVTGQMIAADGGQHLAWRTPDILDA